VTWCWPQEEHVVGVEAVDDAALLLQRQHADVQLPAAQEVQHQLHHLRLLDADGLLRRHGYGGVGAGGHCRWLRWLAGKMEGKVKVEERWMGEGVCVLSNVYYVIGLDLLIK